MSSMTLIDDFQIKMDLEFERTAVLTTYQEVLQLPAENVLQAVRASRLRTYPAEPAILKRAVLQFSLEEEEACATNSQSLGQLARHFEGTESTDALFEETQRWEAVYPESAWDEPYSSSYVKPVGSEILPFERYHDPQLLANSDIACTSWHCDVRPPLSVFSQL